MRTERHCPRGSARDLPGPQGNPSHADASCVSRPAARIALALGLATALVAGGSAALLFARQAKLERARASLKGQDRATALALFQELASDPLDGWDFGLGRRFARALGSGPEDPVADALHQQALLTAGSAEALAALRRAGERGHLEARYELGNVYLEGRGVKADPNEARLWLERAAWAGHAAAQNDLGRLFTSGLVGEPDFVEAATWFRLAADRGSLEAHFNLAQLHLRGLGVDQSPEEAMRWLRPAAEAGSADAAAQLGALLLETAAATPEREAEAARWIERAAVAGHAEALAALALLHELGRGVARDPARALQLLRQAAEAGSSQAALRLGLAYAEGLGVEADLDQAVRWLEQAVEKLPEARSHLSRVQQARATAAQARAEQQQAEGLSRELRLALQRYESVKKLDATLCGQGTVRQIGHDTYQRLSQAEWDLCLSNQEELEKLGASIAALRAQIGSAQAAPAAPQPRLKTCRCSNGSTIEKEEQWVFVNCQSFCRKLGSDSIGNDHWRR